MAAPTLEDYLGLGDMQGYDQTGLSSGAPDTSNTPAITTPGQEQTPITQIPDPSAQTPDTPVDGQAQTARTGPVKAVNLTPVESQTGNGPNPAASAPEAANSSTPTPGGTDYSQLNAILQQLLASSQATNASNADYRNNIKNTVLSLIKSGSAPVDPSDPTILSATSAFRGEGERALALLQEKQAEASKASGRTSGSVESALKGGYEDLGNAEGSYAANLQINELNARRQQLMQAASLGAGVSNADDANALQSQITQIDAQIKELSLKTNTDLTQQGLTNQNTQFYDNLTTTMGSQTNTLDELLSQYLLRAAA